MDYKIPAATWAAGTLHAQVNPGRDVQRRSFGQCLAEAGAKRRIEAELYAASNSIIQMPLAPAPTRRAPGANGYSTLIYYDAFLSGIYDVYPRWARSRG